MPPPAKPDSPTSPAAKARRAMPRRAKASRPAKAPGAPAEAADGSAEPVPHGRGRKIAAKRTAILGAGLKLFSRYGLHGATMEEIAKAAHVSKTNLFYYFASKEEIYVAILRQLLESWFAPLDGLKPEADPVAAIGAYIRQKVIFSRDNPDASRLFCLEIVQGAPLLGPELRGVLKAVVDAKAGVIRAWVAAGKLAAVDPHHLLFSIWATTQHYADFAAQIDAVIGRDLTDETYLEATIANIQRIVLDGVRPRGAGG